MGQVKELLFRGLHFELVNAQRQIEEDNVANAIQILTRATAFTNYIADSLERFVDDLKRGLPTIPRHSQGPRQDSCRSCIDTSSSSSVTRTVDSRKLIETCPTYGPLSARPLNRQACTTR